MEANTFRWPLKAIAWLFSIVFHPLFIPVIGTYFLTYIQPSSLTGLAMSGKGWIVIRVAVNTLFFPLITVLILKGLGFIKSIMLKTARERIIPYVATNIFYFWMFLVFKNQEDIPGIYTVFILGIFLASSAGLILNSFFKISMHGLGMGALCGLLLAEVFDAAPYALFLPLMVVILLTGIVNSSRMVLGGHTLFEVNTGLLVGIVCQLIAAFIFL